MPCVCRRLTLSAWAIDVGSTGQLLYKADMTQNFLCQVKRKMLYTNSHAGVAQQVRTSDDDAGSSPAAGQLIGITARNTIANVDNTGKLSARVFFVPESMGEQKEREQKMITIDEEFASLIPPLTDEEYRGLEASIVSEGCRDALVVWNDILIDGHNRYKICTEHNVSFNTIQREFENREEVLLWIMRNQLSRRNLNDFQRIELVRKCEDAVKAQAKARQGTRNDLGTSGKFCPDVKRATDELGDLAGVSRKTYEHATTVLDEAPEEIIQAVRKGDMSINKAYQHLKKAKKKAERQTAIEEQLSQPKTSQHIDIFTTDKKYRVIYADPPWAYNDKQDTEKLGGAIKHYPTMPLDEICSLPVPAEKDAVLFLWTTSPMLEDSFKVINAWGFQYKSSFIWDKVSHVMGHYNSVRHEFLLVCVKGSCTPDVPKLYDSVVSIERTDHSRKPEEFRKMIDTLYPVGERLEMFARETYEGWDVWGNMA